MLTLDGNWVLKNAEKLVEIAAQVPGTVFESLLEKNIIKDPFYGVNELEMDWVYDADWHYEKQFDIDNIFLDHKNIILRFKGLDTISEILLNGDSLGFTENMFRRYDFDIKSNLKNKGNKLIIKFKSPTKKAREETENYNISLNTGYAAIPGVPYLRKAQFSFGWDWGPKLPDSGIWKPVEIIGYDDIKIDSVHPYSIFDYTKDHPSVKLFIDVELTTDVVDLFKLSSKLLIRVITPNKEIITKDIPLKNKNERIQFDIEKPILWWTHDLGFPHLYIIETSIVKEEVLDTLTQKVGLRDLRLVRESDKWGESFFFQLNGISLFAKGANWIPIDSLIPRGKKLGLYAMNLNFAKDANMNMIRVWGGGIYEDDNFYELCDELGLLVWQDFPFACAFYNFYDKFIENIKIEVIQNLKRLRHHSSLALWCGNNEIEWLWNNLLKNHPQFSNDDIKAKFKSEYLKVFEKMIPDLIKKYDPNRAYWPSSPSNGYIGEELGKINSNTPNFGDSHFWAVWHGGKPFKAYRDFDSRFMSEFGFESFPSVKTLKGFCSQDQFDFYSPIMENHQKNSAGNKKIMDYMEKRFSIPHKFENQVILSQITQAEAIEYGVAHWRQNRNENHCMGALYWQLNDCWPVASWSSIDYYGRWKALHYFAKRFYQPLFASIREEEDKIEFWVSNDLKEPYEITLEWKILSSEGIILIKGSKNFKVDPNNSLKVEMVDINFMNKDKTQKQNNIIFFKLKDQNRQEKIIFHGFHLFNAPKYFSLRDPVLSINSKEINQGDSNQISIELNISTKNIALYVFIESDAIDFVASDNFFSLEPGESRLIRIIIISILDNNLSNESIIDSFKINSLFNLRN